jgi:hypothetical protein
MLWEPFSATRVEQDSSVLTQQSIARLARWVGFLPQIPSVATTVQEDSTQTLLAVQSLKLAYSAARRHDRTTSVWVASAMHGMLIAPTPDALNAPTITIVRVVSVRNAVPRY